MLDVNGTPIYAHESRDIWWGICILHVIANNRCASLWLRDILIMCEVRPGCLGNTKQKGTFHIPEHSYFSYLRLNSQCRRKFIRRKVLWHQKPMFSSIFYFTTIHFLVIGTKFCTYLDSMALVSFQTFTSTNIALLSIISLCILMAFIRGDGVPPKTPITSHKIDPLDTSLTKVSQVWNTSYAEYRYKNGWSVPNDRGFICYIQEKWRHKKSAMNKDISFGQTAME